MHPHITQLIERHPALAKCEDSIAEAYELLRSAFARGNKALICGNGGSAADAEHWAGELLKGFCHQRALTVEDRAKLGEDLGSRLQGALPMIPLTGFLSLTSAFGNDVDPQLAFAQLTWALGREADAWIGISTSGNARNVLAAAQAATASGNGAGHVNSGADGRGWRRAGAYLRGLHSSSRRFNPSRPGTAPARLSHPLLDARRSFFRETCSTLACSRRWLARYCTRQSGRNA
jgi:D-sedoheptulose 7-phosphate isomerase